MMGDAGAARVDLDDILARLTPAAVLGRYSIEVKQPPRGDMYGRTCPRCFHRKSPRALTMNGESGRWCCYACVGNDGKPLGGDLLTFIAMREGLSTSGEDFNRVKTIAAEIAGVEAIDLAPADRQRRRREHRLAMERRDREQKEAARSKRMESVATATAHWIALAMRHDPAERYLRERGVLAIRDMGLVRFDLADRGSIATPLYTSGGDLVNVIRRRLPSHAPTADDRFRPLPGLAARGTYGNSIADIRAGRDVVLCEGFFDTLTAALAWRGSALVIGARSATDLPTIARYAARAVKHAGARLRVAAHRDDAGARAAELACDEALAAGLRVGDGSLAIVKHPEADLNESWCAGWRPE